MMSAYGWGVAVVVRLAQRRTSCTEGMGLSERVDFVPGVGALSGSGCCG